MFRELIVQYTPYAIVAVAVIFILAKYYIITASGIRHEKFRIFFGSFEVLSKQVIKNTFETELRHYLKSSNRVNTLFYSTIGMIIAAYLLMLAI